MRFANAAARHLYKTLVVFQHPDSWHKLELIAACPWLGHLVQRLDDAALNMKTWKPFDFNYWKENTASSRRHWSSTKANAAILVASIMATHNDQELDELLGLPQSYRRHCYWYQGERAVRKIMRKSEGRTPLLRLPLPSLKSIEMAGPSESWTQGPKVKRRERARDWL